MARSEVDINRLAVVRRVIYAMVTVAVVVPLVLGVPVSFRPLDRSRDLYDEMNNLQPGDHVLLSFDYAPDAKAELLPMSLSLLRHCFRNELIPIVMTTWVDGTGLCKQACDTAAEEAGRVSGEDYVFLGFKPGGGSLLLNMGENLKAAFSEDFYGQPTDPMPALKGVDSLRDIDLAIDLAAGPTVEMWVVYGSDRYDFPLAACTTAVIAPKMYPYLNSGQLVALSGGLRATADYEQLIQTPGAASDAMHAVTVTHLLLIVLLVGANVRFVVNRIRGKEGN